jgi:hypothetical protein
MEHVAECVRGRDITALLDLAEEIPAIQTWLTLDAFDRRKVNVDYGSMALGRRSGSGRRNGQNETPSATCR